jgi:protein-S-isoprenylcysteine O-methyltransferase Ste14
MSDKSGSPSPRKFLPPHAFVLSVLAQVPAVYATWPLTPSGLEVALGVVFMLIGFGLNIWADRVFQRRDVGVRPFSPAAELVEEGPFRFSRNPMYLGMVLFSAGIALATGVLINLVFPVLLGVWLDRSFVAAEEGYLTRAFGDAYRAYCRRRPRWLGIPRRG